MSRYAGRSGEAYRLAGTCEAAPARLASAGRQRDRGCSAGLLGQTLCRRALHAERCACGAAEGRARHRAPSARTGRARAHRLRRAWARRERRRISGVVTEKGLIRCQKAVLAAAPGRAFSSATSASTSRSSRSSDPLLRTTPMEGPPTHAVGASDYAFRKRADGGYTIAHRGANLAQIVPDSVRLFADFLPAFRKQRHELRLRSTAASSRRRARPGAGAWTRSRPSSACGSSIRSRIRRSSPKASGTSSRPSPPSAT